MTRSYAVVVYAAIATGAVFLLVSSSFEKQSFDQWLGLLFSEIGMVLLAVGAAHIIYDKLLREETEEKSLARLHAASLGNGLRLVDTERTRSSVYLRWVIEPELKEISIIGRSVLHRMDTWAKEIFNRPIEEIIVKKLERDWVCTILFLDPRMPILDQLIAEEGEGSTMRRDLVNSLQICKRIDSLIMSRRNPYRSLKGQLRIAVYKKNSTFAYHKQGDQILIGFYPLKMKGDHSPVYEAIGSHIGAPFEGHFLRLDKDGETTTLIEYDGSKKSRVFNIDKIDELLK